MDCKLSVEKLLETITCYEKVITDLEDNLKQRNDIYKNLYDTGWEGESKENFKNLHTKNEKLCDEVKSDIQFLKDTLKNSGKEKSIDLKKRCENFVNIISSNRAAGENTADDKGSIAVLKSGVTSIGNIIDTCIDNYYKNMQNTCSEIDEILETLIDKPANLESSMYTCQASLNAQKNNLSDFKDSIGVYSKEFIEMVTSIAKSLSSTSNIQNKENYKRHTTYIYYEPDIKSGDKKHTFNEQAKIEKEKYELENPGTEVILVPITDAEDFKNKWNKMNDSDEIIDNVQIILHGSAADENNDGKGEGFMFFEESPTRIATDKSLYEDESRKGSILISDLDKKKINNLYFSSCNSANKDLKNVVSEFDEITDVNTITGFDGGALYIYDDENTVNSYEDKGPEGFEIPNIFAPQVPVDPSNPYLGTTFPTVFSAHQGTWWRFVERDWFGRATREREGKVTIEKNENR